MNNFSALNRRELADEKESDLFSVQIDIQTEIYFISILRQTVLLCLTYTFILLLSFWTEQTVLLTMETFLQMGEMARNIYSENWMKCRFIN